MAKLLFARIASAIGMTALAVAFLGLIPFLSADPTAGAGLTVRTQTLTVDRTLKGDRMPLPAEINAAVSRVEPKLLPQQSQSQPQEIPFACDAAFSPIVSPRLSLVYGRCLS